jgi:hypothetical protein
MKKLALTTIALALAAGAFAQGTISFQNFVTAQLRAPVYGPEPGNPSARITGNTSTGIPAGGAVYNGQGLSGTAFTVELWGGALGTAESSLQKLDFTFFRTGGGTGLVVGKTTMVPGVQAGERATFQLRAYDNGGGAITSWDNATTRGRSDVFSPTAPLGGTDTSGGVFLTPAGLFGLTSFNLQVPEPSTIALGILGGLGTLVLIRRRK